MRLTCITLLLISLDGFSQRQTFEFRTDNNLTDTLFTQSDSIYNPMTLVFTDNQGVVHYDNVPDSNKYEVCSTVNHEAQEEWERLHFCQADRVGKRTRIIIYTSAPIGYEGIALIISKGIYSVTYSYTTPFPAERSYVIEDQSLVFKNEFKGKPGETIYGYISLMVNVTETFEGETSRRPIHLNGYFKCTIPE